MTVHDGEVVEHQFAVVSWLKKHHRWFESIGKPYGIWYFDEYEDSQENSIVPLSSIVSVMMTANYKIEEESVIVTVPLV